MLEALQKLIGKTPMIKINYLFKGNKRSLFTKLEMFQLSGSIKDRLAFYMIKGAIERKTLKSGHPIVEATSGNTGIALSSIGAILGYPVVIFMPDWVSKERISLMKNYGANVFLVSKEDGGFQECLKLASLYAEEHDGVFMNQFSNTDNILAHYETTGKEIYEQLNGFISSFVSGIGSGGTLMGVGKFLKEKNNSVRLIAMEPKELPILSGGNDLKSHKIEGVGDDFIPSIVDINAIQDVVLIHDEDAIQMARKIAHDLGLGVGISSGANFLASVLEVEKTSGNVVTIFADDNKKYLTTDLNMEENLDMSFLANQIKLIDFEVISNYKK